MEVVLRHGVRHADRRNGVLREDLPAPLSNGPGRSVAASPRQHAFVVLGLVENGGLFVDVPPIERRIDVAGHRRVCSYSRRVLLLRLLWGAVSPLYRFSPRPAFAWRRMLLRFFGASIARGVRVYPSSYFYYPWNVEMGEDVAVGESALIYSLGKIRIGARAMVSQRAHLCAGSHDDQDPRLSLLTPPITIREDVWVCADAFIGPGVVIGTGAVVGARAVVVKDVGAWDVVVGNPARVIRKRVLRNGD